eukprot:TRINITY_DN4532_c0_g1_i1.p1 TRINITY_DN4532_c0_g1~~TRINITY_DN4532_c0_g1_i1.p1  ORF type:complete len:374 (-),score=50.98 TRINITY_DN4532_c0_g1_i1:26-1147(-)
MNSHSSILPLLFLCFWSGTCFLVNSQCPSSACESETCCPIGDGTYACCPIVPGDCCSDGLHCCPSGYNCNYNTGTCTSNEEHVMDLVAVIEPLGVKSICPSGTCPTSETCCDLGYSQYGCCPYINATCCSDLAHCCPQGYNCDLSKSECVKSGNQLNNVLSHSPLTSLSLSLSSRPSACPLGTCPDTETCCNIGADQYGCCPYANAVCCSDHHHCCPSNYVCDVVRGECLQQKLSSVPMIHTKTVHMDDTNSYTDSDSDTDTHSDSDTDTNSNTDSHSVGYNAVDEKINLIHSAQQRTSDGLTVASTCSCPSTSTCCPNTSGSYSCCSFPLATCCSDMTYCCPYGYVCDAVGQNCVHQKESSLTTPLQPIDKY